MPFTVGHKLSKGRPKKSKNVLPIIREKILNKLYHRMDELDTVDVKELLAFVRQIMPKDISLRVSPNIEYISNTPRPIDTIEDTTIPVLPGTIEDSTKSTKEDTKNYITYDTNALKNNIVISNVSNESNDNDTVSIDNVSDNIIGVIDE